MIPDIHSSLSSLSSRLPHWRKDQRGNAFLAMLMAFMSVAWLEPWLMWATRNTAPDRILPLITPELMIVIVLAGAVVTRWAARSPRWHGMAQKVVIGAGLTIVLVEALVFNGRSVGEIVTGFVKWEGFFSPQVVVLIFTAILWWRGIYIGRGDVMREDLEGSFYTGLFALVVLLIFDATRPIVPFAHLFWAALFFFVTSLLALALVGPEHAHFWQRETSVVRLILNRYWLFTISLVIGLIVLVGLLFAASAGEEALGVLKNIVIGVVTGLVVVLQIVMSIVVQIIVWLLTPFMPLFERLAPLVDQALQQVRIILRPPVGGTTPDAARQLFDPAVLESLLRGLAVVAIVMVFLLGFLLILIRLGSLPLRRLDETRDSIATRDLLMDQLKNLLAHWRSRSASPPAPYLTLSGDDTRTIVRRAYQDFLEWARLNTRARTPDQTPVTYGQSLAAELPAQREALETLTETYVRARYSADDLSSADARAAQASLASLQSSSVLKSK